MSSQGAKQLLPTDWLYIMPRNFVKLSTLLIQKCSHKRYAMLATQAVVWAFWSFRILPWCELAWWALKERNSCLLRIDHIIRPLTLLCWALCLFIKLATNDMERSQLFLHDLLLIWDVLMRCERAKQLLLADWLYITLLNSAKMSTLSIEKGSHKQQQGSLL